MQVSPKVWCTPLQPQPQKLHKVTARDPSAAWENGSALKLTRSSCGASGVFPAPSNPSFRRSRTLV